MKTRQSATIFMPQLTLIGNNMKKFKLKLNQVSIFKYIYIIFIIINLFIIFYLYNFFNENLYSAIVVDQSLIEAQARQSMEDVNIEKFNNIIKIVEEKNKH
jgi:hypothetical protein